MVDDGDWMTGCQMANGKRSDKGTRLGAGLMGRYPSGWGSGYMVGSRVVAT